MHLQLLVNKRFSVFLLCVLCFFIQSCAALKPSLLEHRPLFISHPLEDKPVTILYLPEDKSILPLIEESIDDGLTKASRWGEIKSPITVIIYPDHQELERAVRRKGYRWLKGWATETGISLQSPRSWPAFRKKNLFDLMTHELTHVVHFQLAGIKAGRTNNNDPLWFSEGLASYTAGQGYRRYSKTKLLRKLQSNPDFDPMNPAKRYIKDHQKLVYSSAHYLVTYMIETYGEERIQEIMQRIGEGDPFKKAYEKTYHSKLKQLKTPWLLWLKN